MSHVSSETRKLIQSSTALTQAHLALSQAVQRRAAFLYEMILAVSDQLRSVPEVTRKLDLQKREPTTPPRLSEAARNELVCSNLALARAAARRARNLVPRTEPTDDLVSIATIALIEAAQEFDPNRREPGHVGPVPFEAYARKRVFGAIIDEYRHSRHQVAALQVALTDDTAVSEPTDLDHLVELRERVHQVEIVQKRMPERQRFVLDGFYRQQRTIRDLAGDLGLAPRTVQKIRHEAVATIRRLLEAARPVPPVPAKHDCSSSGTSVHEARPAAAQAG